MAGAMLAPDRLADLEAFLLDLNRASGEVILPLFRGDHGLEDKNPGGALDPVTAADKGAEAEIRRLVSKRFPDHGFIGEEYGEDRPDAEFVWVLDPVDGTRAFMSGLPLWTTLIGLRHEGRTVLGSIGQPYLDEVFIGHEGAARLVARGESQPLQVRPCPALSGAVISTTDPDGCFTGEELAAWNRVRSSARLTRLGCDAYAYAMVAAGRMDLVVEAGLKVWDIEAAIPVIAGAGGLVTDWRGQPIGHQGGQMVIAGDPACLEETVGLLRLSAR